MGRPTLRSVVAGAVLTALVCSPSTIALAATTATTSTPASFAPAVVGIGSDASLSALTVTGNAHTPLSPVFTSGTHDYQVVTDDAPSTSVTPTVTQTGAVAVVTAGGTTYQLSSGAAAVPITRGRNDITVTVTSADATRSQVYRVTVWRLAAPTPRIVSVADSTVSVYGGNRITVTLANGSLPDGCSRSWTLEGARYTYQRGADVFDPTTGRTTVVVNLYTDPGKTAGKADLTVSNTCWTPAGTRVVATATAVGAVTFVAGLTVTSAEIPATVTAGTRMTLHATGLNDNARLSYWITDAAGNAMDNVWTWDWTGNNAAYVIVDYPYGNAWYKGSGPRTLHVGSCRSWSYDATCTSLWSKVVNWVQPDPRDVSFTPASGPVTGGSKVRLKGRFVLSGNENLVVKVGGQAVTDYRTITNAAQSSETFDEYAEGYDTLELTVPAAATTGAVPITVTNDVGTTVARGLFTYSARPTIASVTPTVVANAGGSVVTITGSDFGTSGRPTVVVNGVKSPYVTRVSSSTLTAVVPASPGTTGPVTVTVSSPQGGGVSSPAELGYTAPTRAPAITAVTPGSGRSGDVVTLTGSGFGPAGTVGVSVGGSWARVTASSTTSLTFEVPATDTTGAQDVVVGATSGAVTRARGFTVLPDSAITTVTPSSVPSFATGTAAKVTLDGVGFRSAGTVKVGAAAAVSYVATGSGTRIAGVVVPTGVAGSLPVVVTPQGSTTPLRASVRVTAPALSYVGSHPRSDLYGDLVDSSRVGGAVLTVPTTGGSAVLVEGAGFGPAGVAKLAGATVATSSWSDTAVTFTAPAHAAGDVGLVITPSGSTLFAVRTVALRYQTPSAGLPTIGRIASVVDHSRNDRNEFDPQADVSDAFTLTGTYLAGTSPSASRVTVSAGSETFTVVPSSVSAGSLTFAAPRGFTGGGWKDVQVTTNVGSDLVNYGIWYLGAGVSITASPWNGLCLRTSTTGTGSVPYSPAVVTLDNSGTLFGDAGTVTIDGVTITTTSWSSSQIVLSMAGLASDLAQPWGGKTILVTPSDTSLAVQRVGFTCAVQPTLTTTANGSTAQLTVAAGAAYTTGNTATGFVGTPGFSATAPSGYEYVTAVDFGATGFRNAVHAGVPTAAGDWYVRVALSRATYDTVRYLSFEAVPVRVTITGTPITVTPVLAGGTSFTYRGELGDGSGGSPADVRAIPSSTTDPITKVVWEHRDSACASGSPSENWVVGLPKDVARSSTSCGGDGTTVSSWDVHVRSFEMTTTGTDRSVYYEATLPTTRITITPRNLTIGTVRADRVYDGTTVAPLGELTVTGAVAGEVVSLANPNVGGTFADAAPGVDKPVTLGQDLELAGSAKGDYTLTNPRPMIVGTVTKASAVLTLGASASSVLLSRATPVTITAAVRDSRTGGVVPDIANPAPVVLISRTTTVCTISGTTVTAHRAGTCTIAGTQAASTNYRAATAASDPTSTTETIDIQVFPAAQVISVVADDLTIAVGDDLTPTSQVSGLFDGDSVDNLVYDYYAGSSLLTSPPTTPGTYKVMPKAGTLTAADPAVYSNPTSLTYVGGLLVITALPPTITTITGATGPTSGGTVITVSGTRLETVRSVRIGTVTLRSGDFTVNQTGTALTFTSPAVAAPGPVDLVLVAGTATASDTFVYTYQRPTATIPSRPTIRSNVGGDRKTTVTFTPPLSTGGTPITGYQVSVNGGSWRTVLGGGAARSVMITGLTNGSSYSVRVRAVNRIGAGPAATSGRAVANAAPLGNVKPRVPGEVAIPVSPRTYTGRQVYTVARDTSHNGTWAHTAAALGTRQLTKGEAATLSGLGLFEFDSPVLTAVGRAQVKALATHMRLAHSVACEGYTDYAGLASHELTLSAQRAMAVCKALVLYGAKVTFVTHGYGGTRPAVIGGTAVSRAANRRVVLIVTS